MQKLIRKALIASTMATASVAVAATASFGQVAPPADETVNFSGVVGSACTFANPVDGTLVLTPDPAIINSDPGIGALEATVELTCTGAADLSVGRPVDSGSVTTMPDITANPEQFDIVADAFFTDLAGPDQASNLNGTPAPAFIDGPVADMPVRVGMQIRYLDGPIPDGSYSYDLTVTATPL